MEPNLDVEHAAKRKHTWRWISAAVVLILVADGIRILFITDNFGWPVVANAFRAESIIRGLGTTLMLSVVAMTIGIILGVLLALGRLSPNPVLRSVCGAYVWFFRGTPTLVQLIFFYNLSALLPQMNIGIPFGGPLFVSLDTNSLITPLLAAILGLGLNEGAYMSEIVRGGLLSVDSGQRDAAHALGMTNSRVMRRIVLPQAMRFIVPPTGNQVISMVKATSLVSVIALSDLLYAAQAIYNRTFETIPMLIVVCIWYLIITSILYVVQSYIERHYSRGERNQMTTFWDYLRIRPKGIPTIIKEGPTA
jgi:polar amino acid transport system permease protein